MQKEYSTEKLLSWLRRRKARLWIYNAYIK